MRRKSLRGRSHRLENLESRRLLTAVTWTGNGDGSNWNDANNWSNSAIPTVNDDVTIDVSGSITVLVRGSQSAKSLINREEIRLQGDNTFGSASLNVTGTFSNEGTLRFESRDAGYGEVLSGAGTLNNTGTVLSNTGAGGAGGNYIYSNVDNHGTISCQNDLLTTGSTTLNQIAGTIDTSGGGKFTWSSGTVNFSGGTLGSKFFVSAGTLSVASTASGTINVEGSTRLLANNSANVTVWVQGNSTLGSAYLRIDGTVNNSGTILLQNANAGYANYLYPDGDSPKLVNLSGATIRAAGAANTDYTYIDIENHGTIDCQGDLNTAGTITLTQIAGAIDTSGGGSLKWNSGTVNFSGGTVGSNFYVANSTLNVASTAPLTTLNAVGNVHLLANDSPNVTIAVQGNSTYGSAYLTINGSINNSGTVLLQPTAAGYASYLYPEGNSPMFNNLSGATIRSSGDPNTIYIYCNVTNNGTVDCDSDINIVGGPTWNQNGGSIDTSGGGAFRYNSGRFNENGGTVGSGAYFNGTFLDVTASAPTTTLNCFGTCTLIENLSSNVTILSQYSPQFGTSLLQSWADMTHDGTLTNDGTITLGSQVPGGSAYMTVSGTLTNNGTIQTVSDATSYQVFTLADINGTGSISLTANATMASHHIRQNALSVGGRINMSPNGTQAGLSILGSLSITGNGTFDLSNNDMIIDYSAATPLPSVQTAIRTARTNAWNGPGLTSTAAQGNIKSNTTLGAMEASDYKSISQFTQTFDGQAIDNSAVLVKYTYYGDANFNGKIDGGDYSRIDSNFNKEHTSGNIGGWFNGDFDYNGKVDGTDYALIDSTFNSQGAAIVPPATPVIPATSTTPLRKPAMPAL